MGTIETFHGQPSYILNNEQVSVQVTVQGGNLTASFKAGKKEINPFFIAPWWKEPSMTETAPILNVLRGNFFCLPFGDNVEKVKGVKYPPHGQTANDNWDFVSCEEQGKEKRLLLKMVLDKGQGEVFKDIKISEDEPIIYINNKIEGFSGKVPLGYHPTINLPEESGKAILDFSKPVTGFTPPDQPEEPRNGGYSLLKPGIEITDITRVPCINGDDVDLTHCPITQGYEDVVIFINDKNKEFTYTAVTFPEAGYLYFQLKNPRILSETFFWMSNGGRHYPPWNGRVTSTMGLEEVTSLFHYGIKPSIENNFLQEKGYNTHLEFDKNSSEDIKLIMGLIPIPEGFRGIKNIRKKDESTITITGKNGETIDVPCQLSFL